MKFPSLKKENNTNDSAELSVSETMASFFLDIICWKTLIDVLGHFILSTSFQQFCNFVIFNLSTVSILFCCIFYYLEVSSKFSRF